MRGLAGVVIAVALIGHSSSFAAPPTDAGATARDSAVSARPDTVARARPHAVAGAVRRDSTGVPMPSSHPAPPARKSSRPRAAAHDTLSRTQLQKLGLPPAPPPPPGRPPRVSAVAFDVRHRVFGNFREVAIVGPRDEFRIGDSDFTGRIIQFVPDWAMGLETFKVFSRTNEPVNPAFRIVVREQGQVRDTVWAFMHMAPHFARNSLLSFKVMRIEFADHAPVPAVVLDSAAGRASRMPDSTESRGVRP